jgi:hypothetical protein
MIGAPGVGRGNIGLSVKWKMLCEDHGEITSNSSKECVFLFFLLL